ncbi:MAG: hypothetical protein J6K72_10865, partial [Clostridia bacterium]|nr:hypothetical protein [Clostridia bacterium]
GFAGTSVSLWFFGSFLPKQKGTKVYRAAARAERQLPASLFSFDSFLFKKKRRSPHHCFT